MTIHPEALKSSTDTHPEDIYILSFKTKKNINNANPKVTETEPLNNYTNVGINDDIKITFSKNIIISDINSILLKKDNNTIEYVYKIDSNVLTIKPKESLDYNNVYTLDIKNNAIKDLSDNILDNDYKLVFTTKNQNQKNNDAFLNDIKINSGNLSPAFIKNIMNYNVNVEYNTPNIIVTPILSDPNAKMKINGVYATNNTPSGPIQLKVGSNEIKILVTSEDTSITNTYIITIIRNNDNNNNNNNNTTTHHHHRHHHKSKPEPSIVQLDGLVEESLEKEELKVSLSDYNPKAKLNVNSLKKLTDKENLLTIENKDVKISFSPKFLNIDELENEYILFNTNILEEYKQKETIDKLTFINKKNKFEPKGNIFNIDIENIQNEGDKSIKINTFNRPIKVSVDLSHLENTDNLTSIRYEVSDDGSIHPIKMGGVYNDQSNNFIFFTNKSGLYSIEKVDKIQTIELTINQFGSNVNNAYKSNDTTPIIINNRTMVPIRFIAENLGANVKWYENTKTIVIEDDEKQLSMTIDKKLEDFDTAPIILNNRTLVPIRYVSQKLGANVLWFPSNKSIYIVK